MVARVKIGGGSGSEQFAVSKPGKNVLTATDPSDFLFNASSGATEFAQIVSSTTVTPAFGATSTITHSLGFVPIVFVFSSPSPGGSEVEITSSAVTVKCLNALDASNPKTVVILNLPMT